MNKDEYYSRLKKTTSKLLTDRCSYEESHNIALQQIYLKDKYIETLEQENQQLKKQKDDVVEYIKNYDVFKEFSFPLMKKWEENQVKSSIDYQFKETIKKDLLRMLGEIE